MAEALAVVASVVAVLQITSSIISVCYDYNAAVKSVPWELPRFLSELESLRTVLQKLEPLAKQAELTRTPNDSRLPAFSGLCAPNGPLQRCHQDLEKLESTLKSPKWIEGYGPKRTAFVQALSWPLKEKDSGKALKGIREYKNLLSFALQADQAYANSGIFTRPKY